jgi:uncharacterized protein YdhG (YjbR/CyaY superfamily)
MPSTPPATVAAYIAGHPAPIQRRLRQVRATIRRAAPSAEEKISYRIPAYALDGHLIFFAAFKDHIGVYPTTAGMMKYEKEMTPYLSKTARRSLRLPHDQRLPLLLIAKLVKVRLQENRGHAAAKAAKAKARKSGAKTR